MLRFYICVRQHDITDCGAACLATVARTHGLKVPIAVIRQHAGTDRQGTNVLGMVEAAQRLGFEAKGVKAEMDALGQIPLPAIAHVSFGGVLHYVVIHEVKARHITLADPARGIVRSARESFAAIWSGILILLIPGAGFRAEHQPSNSWTRFARLLEPHGFLLVETFLATLFFILLGLGPSIYLQLLVDKILVEKDWTRLRWLSLGLVAVTGVRAAFGMARGVLSAYVGRKIDLSLMLEYYRHILKLPMQFFDTRHTGEIISRLGDAVKIREAVGGATLTLIVDSALMLGGFGVLGFYSAKLAFQGIAMLPLMALLVALVNRPLKRSQRATMEEAATLQSCLVESVAGTAAIKAFGAEEAAAYRTECGFVRLLRNSFRANGWGVSSYTAGEMLLAIGTVGMLWNAGAMVIRGELTVGQMVACFSILVYILQPMLRLIGINQTVQDALVAADRLCEILDLDCENRGDQKRVSLPPDTPGGIDFTNVTFRYGTREYVLENVTLHIRPRSIVAVVGRSGSGKTTLARLLLRFYEPSSGQVEIDGHDVRDLSLETLRARIGYVDQETVLFSDTIEENLTLGDRRVTPEGMIGAVRAAGLESFIAGFPGRYQTYVGERGVKLSGGQRQRLAIARALAHNPQILILDEATSNLDPLSERTILETLERLKQIKTVILIAHRLSTASRADHIVVLERGRVIEQGSHQELMAANGHYRSLWSISG
ncbi:MAG TPA: peptidase domain-containing ABC transporter [Acidobacteriota bacterium]|nr:peptidase domain-containing ABC transporter [Acidobacteriota bacterium]